MSESALTVTISDQTTVPAEGAYAAAAAADYWLSTCETVCSENVTMKFCGTFQPLLDIEDAPESPSKTVTMGFCGCDEK